MSRYLIASEENLAYLAHHGVKGMRWKNHKKTPIKGKKLPTDKLGQLLVGRIKDPTDPNGYKKVKDIHKGFKIPLMNKNKSLDIDYYKDNNGLRKNLYFGYSTNGNHVYTYKPLVKASKDKTAKKKKDKAYIAPLF